MNESVLLLTVVSAIAVGTPILLAGLGEILTEQSGVMNLGIEGMMLVGGVVGFWASTEVSSLPLAFAAGMIAGALMGLIHAFFAVTLRVNQIVSGLALVIAGSGISSFIGSLNDGSLFGSRSITSLDPVLSGPITDLPVVGPLIFGHDWVVYFSWVLAGIASFWLFRTKNGLALRAVGEDPPTADAAGISVARTRYIYTLVGGAGAGFGGAYLTIGVFGIWQNGITAGIGWIAVALVIFAGWRPWRALAAAYVFGVLRNLSFTLQIMGVDVPADFLNALPFILTIVALIIISARPVSARKFSGPSALAVPYARESR
jgi:ABC-type uncharacterized transport system permease subunit